VAPVRIVGADDPVGVSPQVSLTSAPLPALAERESELQALSASHHLALGGQPQLVCLSGQAGIGKTALLRRFLAGLGEGGRRPLVGRGQSVEYVGAGEAYMPVLDALARMSREHQEVDVAAILARHAPSWLVLLPSLVADDRIAGLRERALGSTPDRMLRELAAALDHLGDDRLVVLALEDLQWADPSTLSLVAALARRQAPSRLLVIVTVRTDDTGESGRAFDALAQDLELRGLCRLVRPAPLSEKAIAQVVSERLPGLPIGPALTGLMHSRTGGNPLFTEALTDYWQSSGVVRLEREGWQLAGPEDALGRGTPSTLRAMIQRRLLGVSRDEMEILECASVAGSQFSAALLAAIARQDVEEVETRCVALSIVGLLRERGMAAWPDGTVSGEYAFTHALYQEVLYERVPPVRRTRLHQASGRRLELAYGERAGEHASELAHHFDAGLDAPNAIRFLTIAAERALGRSAHREAAAYLRRGVALAQSLPDSAERQRFEFELHAMLAPTALALEGFASREAEQSFARARELGDTTGRAEQLSSLLFGLAMMYELRGEYPETEALLNTRLSLVQRTSAGDAPVDSETLMACSLFHQGRFSEALDHAETGVTLYDPARHLAVMAAYGENPGVACHGWASLCLWFLGRPDSAVRRIDEAVTLCEAPGHLYSLSAARAHGTHLHQLRRDVDRTSEWADETLRVSQAQGYRYYSAFAHVVQGWVRAKRGDVPGGLERMHQGLAQLKAVSAELDRPYLLALLAEVQIEAGRASEATATLDEAFALVRHSRTFFYEAELLRLKALLAQHASKSPAEVEGLLRQAIVLARKQGAKSLELRATVDLSACLAKQGSTREAHRQLEPLCKTFDEGLDTIDLERARKMLDTRPRKTQARP
jgi:predicted ATPase